MRAYTISKYSDFLNECPSNKFKLMDKSFIQNKLKLHSQMTWDQFMNHKQNKDNNNDIESTSNNNSPNIDINNNKSNNNESLQYNENSDNLNNLYELLVNNITDSKMIKSKLNLLNELVKNNNNK